MDLDTLYHRTVESWADRVNAVARRPVGAPTPCTTGTSASSPTTSPARTPGPRPLMRGSTIEEVGDRFDGDLLGDDPIKSALARRSRRPGGRRDAADARHRPPVVRRGADGRVRPPARRRPPDPRLGPRRRDRRRHPPGPGPAAEVGAWFADREELYRRPARRSAGRLTRRRRRATCWPPSAATRRWSAEPHGRSATASPRRGGSARGGGPAPDDRRLAERPARRCTPSRRAAPRAPRCRRRAGRRPRARAAGAGPAPSPPGGRRGGCSGRPSTSA